MADADVAQRGFLAFIERWGNRLPEPVMLFVWLIGFLVILSVIGDALGWSARISFSGDTAPAGGRIENGMLVFEATSLLTATNVERLFTEMPKTLTGFAPLGFVLVVMLGASIAERSGLFSALIRASLKDIARPFLTPVVAVVGMTSHIAADAAYVVYIPLAALLYAVVGRHPIAGLATGFAAVSGGFAGNLVPSHLDVVLLSFTEAAAQIIDPSWRMNPLANWWFILSIVVLFTPIIWVVTDRFLEPRLGKWEGGCDAALQDELDRTVLAPGERRGLRLAGLAAAGIAVLVAVLVAWPGYAPLLGDGEALTDRTRPLLFALVPLMALLFAATGIAFGVGAGTIRSSGQAVEMMVDGIRGLAPYIVFIFFAAHFVAMFSWSAMGPIAAIQGAETLKALALPAPVLLVSVLLLSSFLDLFIGSAAAKWSALAPVVVPMFMLLGISPDMTTAAYRMGDSYTNIMTPLMSYFPLVLGFARRWDPRFGVGSMLAMMLPYALCFMVAGIALTVTWVTFEWPVGPGAPVHWEMPSSPPGPAR